MMQWLKGKKTYLVAVAFVLVVVCEKILGVDIPGIEVAEDWASYLLAVLGLGAVRAAISKVES